MEFQVVVPRKTLDGCATRREDSFLKDGIMRTLGARGGERRLELAVRGILLSPPNINSSRNIQRLYLSWVLELIHKWIVENRLEVLFLYKRNIFAPLSSSVLSSTSMGTAVALLIVPLPCGAFHLWQFPPKYFCKRTDTFTLLRRNVLFGWLPPNRHRCATPARRFLLQR